ncbi:hypothetical protein CIT292_06856 [Citrobacter youngae ATCC 29220]|uniref:Uncharacterized protein n=1 Tax=Citrobacter youngae ATCC 29220 TaxID=500640 RepID=D4B8S3_9ENTR|nr:hypothetical protein CIT292_06856 [Citrobacter youngae ATCC 29220]
MLKTKPCLGGVFLCLFAGWRRKRLIRPTQVSANFVGLISAAHQANCAHVSTL